MSTALPICQLPTPLQRLERLGSELGIELWMKRDDLTDGPMSGNKARKLQHVLPQAIAAGADTIIVAGSAQSNLCRVATLAGARYGLRSVLVLGTLDGQARPPIEGNLLVSQIAGAEMRWVEMSQLLSRGAAILEEVATELRTRGARPYVVPMGANGALGSIGYVEACAELAAQLPAGGPTTVVYPVASGGTGAGLLLGMKHHRLEMRGIGVLTTFAHEETRTRTQMQRFIAETATRFSLDGDVGPIELVDGSGIGYAKNTPGELQALARLAREEGLLLDPTYNIKAMLKLIELARTGLITGRVVYLNTGGLFALFAYADALRAATGAP